MTIAVLNGPILNLLGEREPHINGHDTLTHVAELCRETASESGPQVDIQELRTTVAGIAMRRIASLAARDSA